MSDLGVLTGGSESWAFGLNDGNVVVGTSNVTGGAFHAFVWDGTNGMRDLNNLISGSSGWTLTRATDIDNNGYITGWGTNGSGNTRAFLLTLTCSGGGGGSAAGRAALASGGGVTDDLGTFDGSAVDSEGVELAHVEVLGGNPGVALEYQVTEPLNSLDPMPESDLATRDGFVGGVGLPRTLKVESTSPIAGLSMAVSMNYTIDEIADLGSAPKELELYVFEKLAGEAEKVWVPAGTNIGESPPTNTVGQSGFAVGDGGLVKYWAVRRGGGVFAVGKGPPADQPATQAEPTPAPRMCGVAMLHPALFGFVILLVCRSRAPAG
jgi:probable HAF family extracellular repeat protein